MLRPSGAPIHRRSRLRRLAAPDARRGLLGAGLRRRLRAGSRDGARPRRRGSAQCVVLDLPAALDGADLPASVLRISGDVLDADAVQRAVAAAGELRIAVTCAGVATPGRLLGRDGPLALDAFERVLRVNARRHAATSCGSRRPRSPTREPVDGERGVLITTASIAAFEGQIGQAAYAASKGGVAALTLPLARELASALIRVVSIAPGHLRHPAARRAAGGGARRAGRGGAAPGRGSAGRRSSPRSCATWSRTRCSTAR